MKIVKLSALIAAAVSLSACESIVTEGAGSLLGSKQDKTVDRGFDSKHLSQLEAGIWIDPQGCHHWIIDDGVEGYLDPRLDKYGKPICFDIGERETAYGPFKSGSTFGDPI